MSQSSLLQFGSMIHRENPSENDNILIYFTDGSCFCNGKKNAMAGFAVIWPYHEEYNFAKKLPPEQPQTNNRAEYSALIHAFLQANRIDPEKKKTLVVYTDSMLLIKSLNEWLPTWKRNNWKKSDGNIVANLDLVKELDFHAQNRKTAFNHVRAHTTKRDWESIHNDMVDKLARNIVAR